MEQSQLPSLESLLANATRPDAPNEIRTGWTPLVLKVDPASFVFSQLNDSIDTASLLPPSQPQQIHDHNALKLAARILRETSFPVAFPTETVYGLGASALDSEAIANVFRAKGRPNDNPLIVHVSSLAMAKFHLLPKATQEFPPHYQLLIDKFWPGPLTILLPKSPALPPSITANNPHVAVRIPSHPVARALIHMCNVPLAAPSANTSTRPSPTRAHHVVQDFSAGNDGSAPGRCVLLVIDGGACEAGIESTVVNGLGDVPWVLRPGGITVEQIRSVKGFDKTMVWRPSGSSSSSSSSSNSNNSSSISNSAETDALVVAPGMKYKHYAPRIPVVLFDEAKDSQSKSNSEKSERIRIGIEDRLLEMLRKQIDSGDKSRWVVALLRTESQTEFVFPRLVHVLRDYGYSDYMYVHQESLGKNSAQVGANLFNALRELEGLEGCKTIFIEGVSEADEGFAVMNRVRKAAVETIWV